MLGEAIAAAFRMEFTHLSDVTQLVRFLIRSVLGMMLGAVIGFERERKGKNAGLRTHILVCVGSTFFVAIPQLAGFDPAALSRIIQGLTAGIGFLGGGAILKHETEDRIDGLTTAASLWLAAAIGIAVGLGQETFAIVGMLVTVFVLAVVGRREKVSKPSAIASP